MTSTSKLFEPLRLRGVTFRNRIFVSPMCQYSSREGMPGEWHLVHLGSRAIGGAGLVMTEATAVTAVGRISPVDAGIWSDEQAAAYAPIARFVREHGAIAGMQLAHAGRKASTDAPWRGGHAVPVEAGGWQPIAPTAAAFGPGYPEPRAMTAGEIEDAVVDFVAAAVRAREAGFEVIELHMAHGYLMHEFLSPLVNRRTDVYGGSLENRMRFPLAVAAEVRKVWPAELPLFARISATDWVDGGWELASSIELARRLREIGVDLVDCSSGGAVPDAKVPVGPDYQVPFAAAIREGAGIATGAVGLITEPAQAEAIVASGKADAVFLARQMLREPYWPQRAARELGASVDGPVQYARAR